ncbi:hypothetical protein [Nocardioides lentus]|uniref:hypothetical protein n=1 Tax=Nocardioides lentus TaxID=338077 RepID=UPI0031DBC43C
MIPHVDVHDGPTRVLPVTPGGAVDVGVGTQDGLRGAGVLLPPGGALPHLLHRVRSTGEAESGPASG